MILDAVAVPRARAYPPRISSFTQPFWQGLAERQWQTTCCNACGKFTFLPKPVCPHCWSPEMRWTPLTNRGTLYSWSRVHAAPKVFDDESPYAVCIVDLDIGLRMACRLIGTDGQQFQCGAAMEIVVLQYQDGPLFAARPA